MNFSGFISILGMFIEIVGAYYLAYSFLNVSPKELFSDLRSIMGNRIKEIDLDKNHFFDSLVKQSIEARSGFFWLMIGLSINIVSVIVSNMFDYKIEDSITKFYFMFAITVIFILIILATQYWNKYRRSSIKKQLKS